MKFHHHHRAWCLKKLEGLHLRIKLSHLLLDDHLRRSRLHSSMWEASPSRDGLRSPPRSPWTRTLPNGII